MRDRTHNLSCSILNENCLQTEFDCAHNQTEMLCILCSTYKYSCTHTHEQRTHVHTAAATATDIPHLSSLVFFTLVCVSERTSECVCRSVVAKAQLVCNMQTHTHTRKSVDRTAAAELCFVCSVAEYFFCCCYTNTLARTDSYARN